jgi:hypothetical protein
MSKDRASLIRVAPHGAFSDYRPTLTPALHYQSALLSINLTPCVPLSLARRGGGIKKRGLRPLLDAPKVREFKRGRASLN